MSQEKKTISYDFSLKRKRQGNEYTFLVKRFSGVLSASFNIRPSLPACCTGYTYVNELKNGLFNNCRPIIKHSMSVQKRDNRAKHSLNKRYMLTF